MTHMSPGWTAEKERVYHAEWRKRNPGKGAEYQSRYRKKHPEKARRWNLEHPEKMKESKAEYNAKHPGRLKAKNKIAYYVFHGRIQKPDRCSSCGRIGTVHGHHNDYSKPLEVEWLCAVCHKAVHREAGLEVEE